MGDDEKLVIGRAYKESVRAAEELEIKGALAVKVVMIAAARVASRFLGRSVSPRDIQSTCPSPDRHSDGQS